MLYEKVRNGKENEREKSNETLTRAMRNELNI